MTDYHNKAAAKFAKKYSDMMVDKTDGAVTTTYALLKSLIKTAFKTGLRSFAKVAWQRGGHPDRDTLCLIATTHNEYVVAAYYTATATWEANKSIFGAYTFEDTDVVRWMPISILNPND